MLRSTLDRIDGDRALNTAVGAFVGVLAILLAVWLVAAVAVGTAELARMIG